MVSFPHCKINLGLRILRKRKDGYHDLETAFYPVPIKDVMEIMESRVGSRESGVKSQESGAGSQEGVQLTGEHSQLTTHYPPFTIHPSRSWMLDTGDIRFNQTGLIVDGKIEDNICVKAYLLLKKDFPLLPPIQIHLHKNIPIGAGLGGGSSDGAFALKLLNEKFILNLSTEQLINYALQLGSDCPFFITNKPCLATGRGESLQPVDLDLSSYSFGIINPGIHISTSLAFSMISPAVPAISIQEIIQKPVSKWKEELQNDFEEPVFAKHPEIKDIKEELYKQGALYAAMTGSGSSVFGLFHKNQLPPELFIQHNYRIDRIS